VGDAVVDDGDLQGTAVVEAARLCAAAGGGKILCSDAVRAVSANRSGCRFGPAFPMDLKGLPDPVLAREVLWDPLPERSAAERLAFRVLGPLEVRIDDRPVAVGGPKERTAVALLLARVNTSVPVDALLDAVWGERPPRTAERTLHAYVARLRRGVRTAGRAPSWQPLAVRTSCGSTPPGSMPSGSRSWPAGGRTNWRRAPTRPRPRCGRRWACGGARRSPSSPRSRPAPRRPDAWTR
jgi:hypothetical protein